MKTIMKVAAVAALFLVSSVAATAQIKVGASVGAGMPMGDFADNAKTGVGGGINGAYMINDNLSVGLGVGYQAFGEEIDGVKFSIIPVAANCSYFFGTEGFKPYAGLDLGVYMAKYELDLGFLGKIDESYSYLGFAPVVGFQYEFSSALALDVNVKYNYLMSKEEEVGSDALSYLGINVGVVYSLGK